MAATQCEHAITLSVVFAISVKFALSVIFATSRLLGRGNWLEIQPALGLVLGGGF